MTTARGAYTFGMQLVALLLCLTLSSAAVDKYPDRTRRDAVANKLLSHLNATDGQQVACGQLVKAAGLCV